MQRAEEVLFPAPRGDFCSPRLAQGAFLGPPIQAPEFRDPSYPKGILMHRIGVIRLLTRQHTSAPQRDFGGSQTLVVIKRTQFPGLSRSPPRPWERPPRLGLSRGAQWLTTVCLHVAASASFSCKTSWGWFSWRCRCLLSS